MSQRSDGSAEVALGASAMAIAERDGYLRRNLVRAAASLAILFGLMVIAGSIFERELLSATHWAYASLGLPGLALILFFADSITAPIPPDLLLVVVAKTELALRWAWLVPLGGVLSTVAGTAGWLLGARLGQHRALAPSIEHFRNRHGGLLQRYDRLTVALGALTPLPFSITCWSAGAVGMPFSRFLPVSLLRVPRYVVYYLAIHYADRMAQIL